MKFNIVDRVVSTFSPEAGVRRARARVLMEIYSEQQRKYEAAAKGRRTSGMPNYDGSQNVETALDLVTLRARSRDMGRNNPWAKKAVASIAANTVGTGIQPSFSSEGRAKGRLEAIKSAWRNWADTTACDFNGKMNFYGIQRLAMRTVAEAGECIILKRRSKNASGIPIQLQILDPDFLDHSKDVKSFSRAGVAGGYITQGVEFDKDGRIRGYWLYRSHPGEFGSYGGSEFVAAEDVIHLYEILRPGQVRGVPFGSSAFLRLKDYNDYEDAEVVRQKIAACFAVFIQDADPSIGAGSGTANAQTLERVEPGIIEHLPPGKSVAFANPPTTTNHDGFSRRNLQGVAAGYGSTYEALTGDLSNVNFSSGRMGWIEAQRQIEIWQYDMLVPQMLDKSWEWFAEGGKVAMLFESGGIRVSWTPPRREMLDPVKETTAMVSQVRAGFKSWSEAIREFGYDPQAVLSELTEDMKSIKAAGLMLDVDGSVPLNNPQAQKSK